MDLTFALAGLAVGLIVGAVLARLYSLKQFNSHKLQQELDSSRQQLSQYRQDVSQHLDVTNQLMTQLQDNYSRIARHVQQSKMQLVEQPAPAKNTDLNYLSTDTAAHIKQSLHQIDEKRRVYSAVDEQPRDYSGEASGLIKERTAKKPE
ncbi:hypothetical protein VT06_05170 [Arsukibacterium sp. MJ3]|jgi:uncharacterized membrane-anchored protein YhcB (DUF1043 family)|uniref:YhcB family protein n=1 Tax=Arsukibacterium sp. MJ3 TaxID=1632859 RepID=UPI00062740CE|nr:YhcB family protein [Arsukibacterium sp. MJ3]KKO49592.1 hypothetical protein VT06_05170 [Arsukibacterium sp. MJ3]